MAMFPARLKIHGVIWQTLLNNFISYPVVPSLSVVAKIQLCRSMPMGCQKKSLPKFGRL
jgi:hypothetical protein